MTHTRLLIPDVPFHPGPTYRPPPKPIRSDVSRGQGSSQSSPISENISSDINLDFEENSPFQEGVISEAYQGLDKSFYQELQEFNDLINTDIFDSNISTKTGRYQQDTEGNPKKSP